MGSRSAIASDVNFAGFTYHDAFVKVGIVSATVQSIKVGEGTVVGGLNMILKDSETFSTHIAVPTVKK